MLYTGVNKHRSVGIYTGASERDEDPLTLGNLNGAGTDPADDITQQAVFHFVSGKPA